MEKKQNTKYNIQQQEELLSNVYVTRGAKAHAVRQSINPSISCLVNQSIDFHRTCKEHCQLPSLSAPPCFTLSFPFPIVIQSIKLRRGQQISCSIFISIPRSINALMLFPHTPSRAPDPVLYTLGTYGLLLQLQHQLRPQRETRDNLHTLPRGYINL